jgi:sulfane dehydrogenase subunit SoxC
MIGLSMAAPASPCPIDFVRTAMASSGMSTPVGRPTLARPPMDPASGVRRIKLQPHKTRQEITAGEDLFVLAHLGIPRVDPARWSLAIDGLVSRPRTLSLDELQARPKAIVDAVHECCGSPLEPTVPTRRAANVRWGGVDLAGLLEESGIDPQATFLWSYGLDGGAFAGKPCDWYLKDLPLARLKAGDVLPAYELNGAPLPALTRYFPLPATSCVSRVK